jgi:uncharacterized Zn finger protein (UPF0148 family)
MGGFLGRGLDVIAGVTVGLIVNIFLNFILFWIPFLGWIIAALISGYIAGRLGGGLAAAILAILGPLIAGLILLLALAILGLGPLGLIFGSVAGVLGAILFIFGVIESIFIGIGGYLGSEEYKPERCPYCGERIKRKTLVCPNCGRELKPGVRPAGIEIVAPEEKPSTTEKKPSLIDQLTKERNEILATLENITKRLAEGRISEETYKKLREELEDKLKRIERLLAEISPKTEQ